MLLQATQPVRPYFALKATSLLIKLCPPSTDAKCDQLAPLLGAVLSFLRQTRMLPNDEDGGKIEQLKERFIHPWVRKLIKNHQTLFIAALMPSPCEEFRVGPEYSQFYSLADRISSNLNLVLLLATYGLLNYDAWFKLLPNYFDAIGKLNTNEDEDRRIEEVLCKLLEVDLCVLPFEQDQTWSFLTQARGEVGIKRLHTATKYKVLVPFKILVDLAFKIFSQESTPEVQTHTDLMALNNRIQQLGLTMGPAHSRTSIFKINDQRPRPISNDFTGQYWSLRILLKTIANQLNDLNVLCSSDLTYVCCCSIKMIAPEVPTNPETESILVQGSANFQVQSHTQVELFDSNNSRNSGLCTDKSASIQKTFLRFR